MFQAHAPPSIHIKYMKFTMWSQEMAAYPTQEKGDTKTGFFIANHSG